VNKVYSGSKTETFCKQQLQVIQFAFEKQR